MAAPTTVSAPIMIRLTNRQPIDISRLLLLIVFILQIVFFNVINVNPYRPLLICKPDRLVVFADPFTIIFDLFNILIVSQNFDPSVKADKLSYCRGGINAIVDRIIDRIPKSLIRKFVVCYSFRKHIIKARGQAWKCLLDLFDAFDYIPCR